MRYCIQTVANKVYTKKSLVLKEFFALEVKLYIKAFSKSRLLTAQRGTSALGAWGPLVLEN